MRKLFLIFGLLFTLTACDQVFVVKEPEATDNEQKPVCKDLCGDDQCQEVVCEAVGCPCAETADTCPKDCAVSKDTTNTEEKTNVDICQDAGGTVGTMTECDKEVETCVLSDGTICPLDEFVSGACEAGVIVEWGESCRVDESELLDCSNSVCPEGTVCYNSQYGGMGPNGPVQGEQLGDLKCHKICTSDEDCADGMSCKKTKIIGGDIVINYQLCF